MAPVAPPVAPVAPVPHAAAAAPVVAPAVAPQAPHPAPQAQQAPAVAPVAPQPPPAPPLNLATIAQQRIIMGGFITARQIELGDLRDLQGLDEAVLTLTVRVQAPEEQAAIDREQAAIDGVQAEEKMARVFLRSQTLE